MTTEPGKPFRASVWPWVAAAAGYTVLALAYAWPLLGSFNSAVPSDIGDPGLEAWGLWWNAHVVPFTTRWWNAPIFYPFSGALALSETFLGLAVIATPLQWSGLGVIATYNVTFLFSFVASAMAAHALAWRLTGRHDAAFVAGLAYGFNPYRASQLPHLHLLAAWWMPLGLLGLHQFLSERRRRALGLFGVCWTLNGLTTAYYLVFFAVLVGFWLLWFARTRRDWMAISTTAILATLPLVPIISGYNHYLSALDAVRGRGEIEAFSADLSAFWAASPYAWLPHHWTVAARPEGELYPGLTIVVLTLIAAGVAWRRSSQSWRPRVRTGVFLTGLAALGIAFLVWVTGGVSGSLFGVSLSVHRPHRLVGIGIWFLVAAMVTDGRFKAGWRRRSVFLFYALAACAMLAFALGPVGRVFDVRFMDKAPYFWLMQLPGGASLRVPARFEMLFVLCLAQTAALAFSRLTPAGGHRTRVVAVALLILAEGWTPNFRIAPSPTMVTLPGLDRATPVLELPVRDLYDDTAAMIRATSHGHPLVNGFSGFFPPHYEPLQEGLRRFDGSAVQALQRFGPLIVLVDSTHDGDRRAAELMGRLPGVRREADSPIGPVFTLPGVPDQRSASRESTLAIVGVEATSNAGQAVAMIDGSLDTRWVTERPQQVGDEVRLTLERPQVVTRLEMDLAGYVVDYPRFLRVSVAVGDEPPQPVWEGGMTGRAVLAAVDDWRRMSLAIDLPPSTTARRVYLTCTESSEHGYWAVSEIRIRGSAAPLQPQ